MRAASHLRLYAPSLTYGGCSLRGLQRRQVALEDRDAAHELPQLRLAAHLQRGIRRMARNFKFRVA